MSFIASHNVSFLLPGFGVCSGFVLHTGAQYARKYGFLNAKLNRNTAMLAVLGGGAFGMFLFAARTGKQEVHNLHPIFQIGAVPKDDAFNYQRTLEKARQRDVGSTSEHDVTHKDDLNLEELGRIRAVRRNSMMDNLTKGHGLSDSHGGHWVSEFDEKKVDRQNLERIRAVRRNSMTDNLTKGHGLSDSHGGHWVDQGKN